MTPSQTIAPKTTAPKMGYGTFELARIPLSAEKILRIHGHKDLSKVNSIIRETAEAMCARAPEILVPELHYRRLDIRALNGGELILDGGTVFHCDAFPRFLSDARAIVVSVATMGVALDRAVGGYVAESDLLEALLLETCGWLGINILTAQFGGFLREIADREGYEVTCRLAPGYSYKINGQSVDWALDQQQGIFAAFDGIDLPVSLQQGRVMLPKISRTGIFGLSPLGGHGGI